MKSIENPRDLLPRVYTIMIGIVAIILLYRPADRYPVLFESLAAAVTIFAAGFFFVMAAITYRYSRDGYLLFVGYAFLISALCELFYLLAGYYSGTPAIWMNGAGESLRLGGHFLLGFGLTAGPFLVKKPVRQRMALVLLFALAVLLIWFTYSRGLVPNSTLGKGLDLQKFYGLSIPICFGAAFLTHYLQRKQLHRSLYLTISACIIFLTLADLSSFFMNREYFDWIDYGEGICRILGYLMAFRGIVMMSIEIPYEVIFKELKDSATLDPLTGLLNRKGLNDVIQKELACRPEADSVGVLLMDLDGFKMVNDRYGHSMGDYLLIEFAKVLKTCLRGTDVLCRLGGDEFLVLVKAGQTELSMVRQRIQDAVTRWRERDKMAHQIGVSIGSSTWNLLKTRDVSQLIMEADQDMYWEKKKRKLLEKSGKHPF